MQQVEASSLSPPRCDAHHRNVAFRQAVRTFSARGPSNAGLQSRTTVMKELAMLVAFALAAVMGMLLWLFLPLSTC